MKRGTLPIQTATTLELFGTGRILFLAGSPIRRKATTSCSVCGKLLTFLVTVVGALLTYAQLRQVPLSSIRERCGSVEVSCPVGEPAAVIFQYAALLGLSSLNKKRPKFNCAEGYEWLRAHFRANSFNSDVHVMHTEKFDPAKDKCCQFKEELLNLPCESDAVVRHNLRSFLYFQDQRKKMQSELMPKDLNANCRPSNGSLGDEELRSKANCSRIGIYMPWRRPPNETDVKIESLFLGKAIDHLRNYYNGSCLTFLVVTDQSTYPSYHFDIANISTETVSSPSQKLCLLSQMNALIISGEGLSWWAAYLCNGIVLYPNFFCPEGRCSWKEFYFPPDWIQI